MLRRAASRLAKLLHEGSLLTDKTLISSNPTQASSTIISSFQRRFYYRPSHLSFPNRGGSSSRDIDPDKAIWGLIAANTGIYLLWQTNPHFCQQHFVVSSNAVSNARPHTILTSAFSHYSLTHLGANMITLYFFGRDIAYRFGGRKLIGLYLLGGISGSIAHIAWSEYKEREKSQTRRRFTSSSSSSSSQWWGSEPTSGDYWNNNTNNNKSSSSLLSLSSTSGALGASASVNAIMIVDVLLNPTRTILLYGIIPMPALLLGGLWLMRDVTGAMDTTTRGGGGGGIAHAGHLGGAALGVLFFLGIKTGRIRPGGGNIRYW